MNCHRAAVGPAVLLLGRAHRLDELVNGAENRWVVLLATAALVLIAAWVLRTIPVDAIRDLSDTQVIVMKRVVAPMVGGLATSFAPELLVSPAIHLLWRWHTEVRHAAAG